MDFLDYQDFYARFEMKIFAIETSFLLQKTKRPIETLMEEILPVLTEKDQFEYGDKSTIKSFLLNFRTVRSLTEGSKRSIFQSNGKLQIESYCLRF